MIKQIQKIFSDLLRKLADEIDSGKYESDEEEIITAIDWLSELNSDRPMSKDQACSYLNVGRSTFDTYVRNGQISKGKKCRGFKELSWSKSELDRAIIKIRDVQ